jgi:hypothetical protein
LALQVEHALRGGHGCRQALDLVGVLHQQLARLFDPALILQQDGPPRALARHLLDHRLGHLRVGAGLHLLLRVGEAPADAGIQRLARAAAGKRVGDLDEAQLPLAVRGQRLVELDLQQHVVLGCGIDLVERELGLLAVDGAVPAQGPHGPHAGLQLDVDRHGLRARAQDVVELLVEDLDEVGGLAGEGVVAVAGARQLQHQVLVVAQTEADRC